MPAKAADLTTLTAPGSTALASILVGLGISPGDSSDTFNQVVDDCLTYLMENDLCSSTGQITVYLSGNKYYVSESIIQAIHSWLFDTSVVVSPVPTFSDAGLASGIDHSDVQGAIDVAATHKYAVYGVYGGFNFGDVGYVAYSDNYPLGYVYDSDFKLYYLRTNPSSSFRHFYYRNAIPGYAWSSITQGFPKSNFSGIVFFGTSVVETDQDLILMEISSGSLEDGYSSWAEGAISTEDGSSAYPIVLFPTVGGVGDLSQGDVWSGSLPDDSGDSGNTGGSGSGAGTVFLTVSYETREEYLPGSTVQFSVSFSSSGTEITDRSVTWSVNGYSSNTKIDGSGLLTIGDDETEHTLTVTATSTAYGVSDTCDLTWGDDHDIPNETDPDETVPDETVDPTESLLEEIKQGVDDLNEGVAGLDEKVGDIDINTGFIQNDLESLVEGDDASHAVSGGINEGADGIDSDMGEVDGFQQEQMDILDDKYDEIEQSVDHGSFIPALQFVFKYTNMLYEGVADYAIVFTLPLYLGLFFFLCSRIPGNTGYKMHARKKGKK